MAIHRVGRSRLGVANRSRLGVLTAGGEVKNLIIVIGDYDVGYQYYGSPPPPQGMLRRLSPLTSMIYGNQPESMVDGT